MKQLFVLISVISLLLSCKDDRKAFYENGSIKTIWECAGDTLNCQKRGFWENGNLSYVLNYHNGKENGAFQYFYDNGNISMEGFYRDGKMIGRYVKYYPQEGKLKMEGYIIRYGGKDYHYYYREFNEQGVTIINKEFLKIGLEEESAAGSKKNIVFDYVGHEIYDSMKIVIGVLSDNFESNGKGDIDTISIKKEGLLVPFKKSYISDGDVIRGSFIGFTSKESEDGVIINARIQYFEEHLSTIHKVESRIPQIPQSGT